MKCQLCRKNPAHTWKTPYASGKYRYCKECRSDIAKINRSKRGQWYFCEYCGSDLINEDGVFRHPFLKGNHKPVPCPFNLQPHGEKGDGEKR